MEKRVVLIGAGSVQFGFDTLGDIFQSKVLTGCHVVLHDINPEALAFVEKSGREFIAANQLPHTISASTDRKEALKGADFCVIAIEVGDRFALLDQDWRLPQQFGFYQVMGENGGPGGLFHSLRVIPPILEICKDIQHICPKAIVFNFSNPMSRICTTVNRKFPDLSFVGLCHEISSLEDHLPQILDTTMDNLTIRAGGLNHLSMVLEASYKDTGKDAYPDILDKAPAYFEGLIGLRELVRQLKAAEAGSTPGSEPALRPDADKWAERRIFKVFLEKFKLMPITTDSHLGEYLQWAKDAADHKGVIDFLDFYKQWLAEKAPQIEMKLAERVVPIMDGIISGNEYEEAAVNIPNNGYIDHLPEFLVVEVPAIVNKSGVNGVKLGELPKGFAGILHNQVAVHDLTAEAVLQQSRYLALQALLVDPTIDKVDDAEKLLDTMISLQGDYLGYLK